MNEEKILLDKWFEKKISISIGKLLIAGILLLLCYLVLNTFISRSALLGGAGDKDTSGLEIGGLIRKVKTELMKADTDRINNNERALFKLKDFQMEISFTVRSVYKGGAKMDYKFVTVEGGSETGNEKVQKLTLHWDAIPAQRVTISNKPDTAKVIIRSSSP